MPRPKIKWEYLAKKITDKDGTGFGNDYRPWITLERWNTSKVSTQCIKSIPPFSRASHFLSMNEYNLGLAFAWAGAEIREQFPLWPWDHPHPECGRNIATDRFLPHAMGTNNICEIIGITPGVYPGTDITFIWTMDMCLHLPWVKDPLKSSAMISVKPVSQVSTDQGISLSRVNEKLEIERNYCKVIGMHYIWGDDDAFPKVLFANLDNLRGSAVIPVHHPANRIMQSFLDTHAHKLQDEAIEFTQLVLQQDYNCDLTTGALIQNHLLWHQIIDANLAETLIYKRKPKVGGRELITKIRRVLEGHSGEQ